MDDEGGHRPVPIYNHFVDAAISLNPQFIVMITPSRWMAGGLGLSDYRARMLANRKIRVIVDFPVASEVFAGVEIKGGVSYFLWNRDEEGLCEFTLRRGDEVVGPDARDLSEFDVLVRDSRALPLLRRILAQKESAFADLVASVRPFGDQLRSNFKKFYKTRKNKKTELRLFMNEGTTRHQRWVDESYVTKNIALSRAWKIYLPVASSDGGQKLPDVVLGRSIVDGPRSVCTETYLAIGPYKTKTEAESAQSYLNTRFARFLISLRKPGQHSIPSTFAWLPQQTWDRTWTDAELYKKYRITKEEQEYIEAMVKEMPA
jgi:site-specific DNA-methyltransferase (adenine-specific)